MNMAILLACMSVHSVPIEAIRGHEHLCVGAVNLGHTTLNVPISKVLRAVNILKHGDNSPVQWSLSLIHELLRTLDFLTPYLLLLIFLFDFVVIRKYTSIKKSWDIIYMYNIQKINFTKTDFKNSRKFLIKVLELSWIKYLNWIKNLH